MIEKLVGSSLNKGGSLSPLEQQIIEIERSFGTVLATMFIVGLKALVRVGVDTTYDNVSILLRKDEEDLAIHAPGQIGAGALNVVYLVPTHAGVLLVAYSPSAKKDDGLPGAKYCSKHFKREPSLSKIRHITTGGWGIEDYVIV